MKDITIDPSYVVNETMGITQANWDAPAHLATGQLSMHKLFKTVALEPGTHTIELPVSKTVLDLEGMQFPDPLMDGRQINGEQLLNRRIFNDGLLVMHRGEIVHESSRNGMTDHDRHVIHSCTKSLCSMLVAIAIEASLLHPEVEISRYVPEFQGRAEWAGGSVDANSHLHRKRPPSEIVWGVGRTVWRTPTVRIVLGLHQVDDIRKKRLGTVNNVGARSVTFSVDRELARCAIHLERVHATAHR